MMLRRRRVQWTLTLFAATMLGALLVVAAVAVSAIATSERLAVGEARADSAALEEAGLVEELLYQKGFVATYFLTHDARWLDALRAARPSFERRLERLRAAARTESGEPDGVSDGPALEHLFAAYRAYDVARDQAIDTFHRGDEPAATAQLLALQPRVEALREAAGALLAERHAAVARSIARAEAARRRATVGLGVAALLALLAAALVGFGLARRVTRPLYELVLRAESAGASATMARVEVSPVDEIGALGAHLARLAAEIESSSAELAEQRRRLAQAEKMSALGEVATAVAHQVLNPLCGMKAALQLLARDERPTREAVQETALAVDGEIRRVEGMARRLMSYARPLAPERRPIAVAALFHDVEQATRGEAAGAGVTVTCEAASLPLVDGDRALLVELLVNLTVNACQAIASASGGRSGGTVRLVARSDAGAAILEVIDDGPGIAPDMLSRLFRPFVTSRPGGHGLGLAVAENIALAHGGTLAARSSERGGATFALCLPPVEPRALDGASAAAALEETPLSIALRLPAVSER